MIVTSSSDASKWELYNFLKDRGVMRSRDEDFQAIGNLNTKTMQLAGVVGYTGFTGAVCSMHMAGIGNWITRELLWTAFDYPFNQVNMVQVFGYVSAHNTKALKLDKHLGFRTLLVVEGGWGLEVDMHVLTMRKEDCRWLNIKRKLKVA